MRRIAACLILLTFLLMFAGCNNDAPGGEVQLGREFDFSGVTQVKLVNGHNGSTSFITDENAIAEITSFVGDTIGKSLGSGKGYYEGSYSVVFTYENGEEFSLSYGDDDVFYMGLGDDGYPVRYALCHINISDDVIPFFSQYDQSDFVWREVEK